MSDIYEGNSKSGFIKSMPLEEYQALAAALRALVTDQDGHLPAGVADYDGHEYCVYCDNADWGDFRDVGHKSDCPIVKGRKALQ